MLLEFKLKDGTSKYVFKDDIDRYPSEYIEIMPPNPKVIHSTWTAFTEISMFDSVNSIHVATSLFIKGGREEKEHKQYQEARRRSQ